MASHLEGRRFFKMTGSGNDFVVFDASGGAAEDLETPETIRALSSRGTGVGADGVVFLERAGKGDVGMRYYNSDGSEAALCGNASLCSTRLAVELGMAQAGGFILHTAAGALRARLRDGLPEVDLEP
jgi:diaminopimelate epimerase